MKHFLTVLLCLFLLGCTPAPDTQASETTAETQAAPEKTGLYDPAHPMEQTYPGMVRAYPLPRQETGGIHTLGSDVLILSGNRQTTLTLYSGEELREQASITLDFELLQEEPSLQIHENGISFFHPRQQETLLLDKDFQELRRIAAPPGLSGTPILSSDTKTLYYCTAWAVMAWDLDSGIRRTVKELTYDSQALTALHRKDQILECTITDGDRTDILLLNALNGTQLAALPETAGVSTGSQGYFSVFREGFQELLIFGSEGNASELLLPRFYPDRHFYLKEDHAAVTLSTREEGLCLDYYELNTGILRSSLVLEGAQTVKNIVNSKGHSVYILACDPAADGEILYRWDVLRQAPDPANTTVYTAAYHSSDAPDPEALEHCRELSRSIGEKYGIAIRILEDACSTQPWDYRFSPECLVPVLERELELLDRCLSRYPDEVLQQTLSHFSGLTLCLVREISGTADSNSLTSATGIQFFDENEAYLVIATGKHSEQALYHELYHVMDTHILTESTALDLWETLNPAGFTYSSGAPVSDDFDIYLQGQTRAFADSYSMRYPKEDRARIFEYAMLRGGEYIFRSEYMQRKLTALCLGIREAYGLKKLPEPLPWEQYLATPLTPAA